MKNQSKLPLIIFVLVLFVICAIAGQFAGSYVFARLAGIKDWGFLTLWQYKSSAFATKSAIQWRLNVGFGVSILIAVLPVFLMLAALIGGRTKRELHGSQRFATIAEIRKKGLLPTDKEVEEQTAKGRPPIYVGGKIGKRFLRWCSNEFMLLAAMTRAGKGISTVITNCLHYAHSMVIFDPKFENYLLTSGHRQSQGQKVFLFNPSGVFPTVKKAEEEKMSEAALAKLKAKTRSGRVVQSHRWNPFSYISRDKLFMYKELDKLASILYPTSAKESQNSNFWTANAQALFVGLAMYMLETEPRDEDGNPIKDEKDKRYGKRYEHDHNGVSSFALLVKMTTPKGGRMSLHDWIRHKVLGHPIPKGKEYVGKPFAAKISEECINQLSAFANQNEKTANDILSTMLEKLKIFRDPLVAAATSGDDFDLRNVRREKTTIYLGISPDEIKRFEFLTNLFFSQLIAENIQQGLPENNPELKYQCLLLLDEFTALGYVPILEEAVSYIAGYNLRLLLIFQSPAQVERKYSKEGKRTFFSNFAVQTLFHCRDQEDAEYYARLVGHNTVQSKTKSKSFGKGTSRSVNVSDQKRDLLNADEFKTLPMEKCVITITNSFPIWADKIMYYKEEIFDGLIDKEPSEVLNLLEVIPDDSKGTQTQNSDNQPQNTVSQEPDFDREAMWDSFLGDNDDNGVLPADEIDIIRDNEVTADEADDYVDKMFRYCFEKSEKSELLDRLTENISLHDFVDSILGEDARELIKNFSNENEFAYI